MWWEGVDPKERATASAKLTLIGIDGSKETDICILNVEEGSERFWGQGSIEKTFKNPTKYDFFYIEQDAREVDPKFEVWGSHVELETQPPSGIPGFPSVSIILGLLLIVGLYLRSRRAPSRDAIL